MTRRSSHTLDFSARPIALTTAVSFAAYVVFAYLPRAFAESDTTNIISGFSTNWPGTDYYVGNTGTNNYLEISSGGEMTVVGRAYIGGQASANGNVALITNTNSLWNVSGLSLDLGYYGAQNRLTISDGGRLTVGEWIVMGAYSSSSSNTLLLTGTGSACYYGTSLEVGDTGSGNSLVISCGGKAYGGPWSGGYIGYNVSSNNSALVTDPGSIWSNREFVVGFGGSCCRLAVTNGGTVLADYGTVGSLGQAKSNSVILSGAGSLWSNNLELTVGALGVNNRILVNNGGRLYSANAYMATYAQSAGNLVEVSDSESVWVNSQSIHVGDNGSSNMLAISDGGTVTADSIYLGYGPTSSSNQIIVSGGNLFVTNAGSTGMIVITRSSLVLNGGMIVADKLCVGDGTLQLNSGTCWLGSITVSSNGSTVAFPNNIHWTTDGSGNFGATVANSIFVVSSDGDTDGDGVGNAREVQMGRNPLLHDRTHDLPWLQLLLGP